MNRVYGFLFLVLVACDGGGGPTIQPVSPVTGRVAVELTIDLAFDNPDGRAVDLRIAPTDVMGFERVTSVTASPMGGTFRWVPLASQAGDHAITFLLTSPDGGTEYDQETVNITIEAAEDAAPVFVRPGAGGTYDLTTSPCVTFDVEVRDDDTNVVDIGVRGELPEQASLANAGDKRAIFDWCPTPDQIGASERYTIPLFADDGEHPAVEHDYIIVLRAGPGRDDCPGGSPSVSLGSPRMDERVTSGTGYPVEVTVTDDMGLRDAPLLYYTLAAPEDPSMPDVTQFEQITFDDLGGGMFSARIPTLGLAVGEESTVYFIVSASDNDDPAGSLCDHRTETALTSFVAVGAEGGGGTLDECDPCGASDDCASGICASSAGGGRCAAACPDGECAAGTCGATVTTEGATRAGCGPVSEACGGGPTMCTDDSREENDSTSAATPYTAAITGVQVCPMDDDYYSVSVPSGNRLTVTVNDFVHVEGDLDLQLRSSTGMILGSSASVRDMETINYCNGGSSATLYARVFGFGAEQNSYAISMTNVADATCCDDDAFENDDTRTSARTVTFASDLASPEGTLCTSDDDWIAIPMSGPGRIEATVIFDNVAGDVDIELYGPTGTRIASSAGTTDTEEINTTVSGGGTYALRVLLYRGNNADGWAGEIRRSFGTTCSDTIACPSGTVCNAGSCVSDVCTSTSMCPAGHICPTAGPAGAVRHCADVCTVNGDCRSNESCKWFVEGRGCGVRGSAANGAPCASSSDCGVQRTCLAWPGGYCARAGCTRASDCESGTHCVAEGGVNVCALACTIFGTPEQDPCRYGEEHWCDERPAVGGTGTVEACVPF